MADTVTLDPGTGGAVIATDDAGAAGHVQVNKLAISADGSATAIPADATNGLDVDVTRVQGTVTVTGTVTANLGTAAVTNAGTFATQDSEKVADNASFTDGTTKVQPVGYVFDEVAGTALTENDIAASRIDSKRAQVGVIEDATTRGQRAAVSAGGALKVDGSAVTQPVSLAGTQSVNQAQVAGTTTDTNSGNKSAGTQRVVLATDQPALTNALKVDGSAVTQPVSGTVTANLGTAAVTNAGTFAVQDSEKIADDAAFTVGTTKVTPVGYLADQTSTDSVNEGDIGAARMTLDRKQIFTQAPSVDTEGASIAMNIDVDETEDAVKASAGKILGWFIYNDGASEVYVKFYNDTVANVVVGTTVPVLTIPIPAGSASNVSWGAIGGIPFSAAITIAATTAVTTADTGAPATNQVVANILYV